MIPGLRIGRFIALPGLTRMETLEREVIRHALVLCHKHGWDGRVLPGTVNKAGAARYLGIGRQTLYMKLRHYAAVGHRIGGQIGGPRRVPGDRLAKALKKLGIAMPKTLWTQGVEDQRDLLREANRARLVLLDLEHPDHGGSAALAVQTNVAWKRVKTIFKRRGIEL